MNGNAPDRSSPARDRSLVVGWSIDRVWFLAIALSSLIAAADAILRRRVILIGGLVIGPCCGLLAGRRARTAAAGAWAVALAVLLGVPDGNFGSWTHLAFLSSVLIVAIGTTTSAALIERGRRDDRR